MPSCEPKRSQGGLTGILRSVSPSLWPGCCCLPSPPPSCSQLTRATAFPSCGPRRGSWRPSFCISKCQVDVPSPSWAPSPVRSRSQTRGKMTEGVVRQDAELLFFAFFLPQSTVATSVTLAVPHLPLLAPEWPPGVTASSTSWYLKLGDRGGWGGSQGDSKLLGSKWAPLRSLRRSHDIGLWQR